MTLHTLPLFSIGDEVRSIDLLTKGTVIQIEHKHPNCPLYRIEFQLWPSDPKKSVVKAEDELLGGDEATQYWMLWMADRDAARHYMLGVMKKRGYDRAKADYQRGAAA